MTPPVVYLDTCAVHRLTDDLRQPRLHAEAQAIRSIFILIEAKEIRWVASTLLSWEISQNPDPYKRVFGLSLLPSPAELILATAATLARAAELGRQGLKAEDALHLALAEQGNAEWLITTEDRFLRRTANRRQPPECINPVDWMRRRQLWLVPKP